jgi:CPA1 family monovalent cation:H+ antiporter
VSDIEFLLLLLLVAAAVVRGADLAGIPYPIVLVVFGFAVGFVPSLPDITVDPDVVFLVFLPPLLASAGFRASPQELREEAAALGFLAVALVVGTMCVVAVVAHAAIDGLGWAEAFVLGAVVSPTDPVSATATFGRMRVPQPVALLVEGEAMINDATALVAFGTAVTAVTTGSFAFGHAIGDVVVSAIGGVAIGLCGGAVQRATVRRLDDRSLAILLTLLVPYGAYILAEESGVSGVLAAVTGGLYLGWHQHDAFSADTRLSAVAFWEVLVFGLNAFVFLLLGLQLPTLYDSATIGLTSVIGAALLVSATVIAVRLAAQFLPGRLVGEDWRERVAIGWSGMRGAISLAAALSVPISVHERPQIVFVTVVVILVTLVGQGLTMPLLLRGLGLRGERVWSPDEAIARLEAAQAALDRLDELEDEGATEEQLRRLRDLYRARFRACQAALAGDQERAAAREPRVRYSELRRDLIAVERATLLDLRGEGRVRQDTLRLVERDLDLEEARLRVG